MAHKTGLFTLPSIMKNEPNVIVVPEAIRHDYVLHSGRNLSYYTFDTLKKPSNAHPVLYFHGFPASGLEGAVCAEEVANAGGQLFAPDRPGFGFSDPLPTDLPNTFGPEYNTEQDAWQQRLIGDLWSFIRHCGWTSFSVIGVSGGGPYTLAMLNSYLDLCQTTEGAPATLEAVSLVAGICCSAGTEGLMPGGQQLYNLSSNYQSSCWARTNLKATFVVPQYLLKILPTSFMVKLMPIKDFPKVDKDMIHNHSEVMSFMLTGLKEALRQGTNATEWEVTVLYRPQQGYEKSLQKHCESSVLPRIKIFQGSVDVNVPRHHAKFIHESLLKSKSEFLEYPELGHFSLVVDKRADYAGFVTLRGK